MEPAFASTIKFFFQSHLISVTISQISRILIFFYDTGLVKETAITLERLFASHYVGDYESTKRPWISYLANGGSLLLTATFFCLFQLGSYFMLFMTLLAAVIFVSSSFAVAVAYRRDMAKLRDLSNEASHSIVN
ncbi:unnamed protein product, partial [Strongylus vulgaris]